MRKRIELYLITLKTPGIGPIRTWVDITDKVEQGITLDDSCDGTLDSGKLLFTIEEGTNLGLLDITNPLPPRIPVRIGEYESEDNQDLQVSYIFETSDCAVTPIRMPSDDDNGHVPGIYQHEINLIELTKELEGKFPPNLSVRQPKNLYSRIYQRNVKWEFDLGSDIQIANGSSKSFTAVNVNNSFNLNNESGVVSLDNQATAKVKIETKYASDGITPLTGIALEDYSFTVSMHLRSQAPQIIKRQQMLWLPDDVFVYPATNTYSTGKITFYDRLAVTIFLKAEYYDINNIKINEATFQRTINWYGDGDITDLWNQGEFPEVPITDREKVATSSEAIIIPKNASAAYVIITPTYKVPTRAVAHDAGSPGFGYGGLKNVTQGPTYTQWTWAHSPYGTPVVNKGVLLRFIPREFSMSITSTSIQESVLDRYKTLYDVANTALQEVNLKQRRKYYFSRRLTALLQSKKAPEATLEDYNLRELLSKFCRILEVVPILGDSDILDSDEDPLTTISYVKPSEQYQDYTFELDEYVDTEKANTLEEFYDIVSSRLYNLISEEDYHTESVIIQPTDTEHAQITQDSAGFVTSYPIYWLRQLKIKGIGIPFSYKNSNNTVTGTIYGNDPNYAPTDAVNQSWDVSDRCFEEDIYNALPDVNYITNPSTGSSGGRLSGSLSKSNSISYKSGSPYIKNLGHTGPAIPDYEPPFTSALQIIPNLAIVECAIVLAYQAWYNNYDAFVIDTAPLSTTITDLLNIQAEITYTALNEFTYRHYTQQYRKVGKAVEHRVNTQDKVSSYEDTTYYIKAEQQKQGNIITSPTMIYPNIMSCLRTGLKVNNGYVITTRRMKIFNEYVECSYELTKEYLLQSDNVKLDIEYERYSVPYDFVWREVLQYSHILLSNSTYDFMPYMNDNKNCIRDTFIDMLAGFKNKPRQLYGKADFTYFVRPNGVPIQSPRSAVIKMHLLATDTQITYVGKCVDNYSAGNQVWYVGSYNYAEPFRYCDSLGKVETVIFTLYTGVSFNAAKFPAANSLQQPGNVIVTTNAVGATFKQGYNKDAREGYEFNITGVTESVVEDIVFISSKGTPKYCWFLDNDIHTLNETTQLKDLIVVHQNDLPQHTVPFTESSGTSPIRRYRIPIAIDEEDDHLVLPPTRKPIAILGEDENGEVFIKLILKNYTTSRGNFSSVGYPSLYVTTLYAIATPYGQHENE